jgi:hypothetical protein
MAEDLREFDNMKAPQHHSAGHNRMQGLGLAPALSCIENAQPVDNMPICLSAHSIARAWVHIRPQ